ncbi:MAG: hypothetical protein ACT4NX_04360 [Deltaproteobacteria bacterium]
MKISSILSSFFGGLFDGDKIEAFHKPIENKFGIYGVSVEVYWEDQ